MDAMRFKETADVEIRRKALSKLIAQIPQMVPPAPVGTFRKLGRNEICPCGSGKKNKRCCNQTRIPKKRCL